MASIALGLYLLAHVLPLVVVAGTALAGNGLVAICTGNGIEFVRVADGVGPGFAVDPLSREDGQQADGSHCAGCLAAGCKLLPQETLVETSRKMVGSRLVLPASDIRAGDATQALPPIRAPPVLAG